MILVINAIIIWLNNTNLLLPQNKNKHKNKTKLSYQRIILWLMLSSNGKGDELGLSTPSKGTETDACWDCGASPHLLSTCGETIGSGTWPKGSGSIMILIQPVIKYFK